jgi:hypothetical protein
VADLDATAPEDMPRYDTPACLPVDTPLLSPQHTLDDASAPPPGGASYDLGHSLDLVTFGPPPAWGTGDYRTFQELVAGAPSLSAGAPPAPGRVRLVRVDTSTGELDPSSGHAVQELISPFGINSAFGASVLAADWADPYESPFIGSPKPVQYAGQELLVGAPGAAASEGRVQIYRTEISDTDKFTTSDQRASWTWAPGPVLTRPGTSPGWAQFGTAMAAATDEVGTTSPWIAISGPGVGEVYIYQKFGRFPLADELRHVQTIPLSGLGTSPPPLTQVAFGAALQADDFDGDGIVDLAIGTPATSIHTESRVYVVGGDESGAAPLDPTDVVELKGSLGDATSLGVSLASGATHLFPITMELNGEEVVVWKTRRMLYMGAPDTDGGRGGVCWFAFEEDENGTKDLGPYSDFKTEPVCTRSPLNGAAFADARWGAAVTVANLSPVDPYLDDASPLALLDEVAVGAPGAEDFHWLDTAVLNQPSSFIGAEDPSIDPSGLVTIYRGTRDGPIIEAFPDVNILTRPLGERFLNPDATRFSRFGTSLLPIDAERSDRMDLVVGAPGWNANRGAFQLLSSGPINGMAVATTDGAGIFDATDVDGDPWLDADGDPLQVIVIPGQTGAGDPALVLRSTTSMELVFERNNGNICRDSGRDLIFVFPLDLRVAHELGTPPSDFTTCYDLRQPESPQVVLCSSINTTDYPAAGTAAWIEYTVADTGFGDASLTNDEVTFEVKNVKAWASPLGLPLGWYGANFFGCTLRGNPFTLTHDSPLVQSCD